MSSTMRSKLYNVIIEFKESPFGRFFDRMEKDN